MCGTPRLLDAAASLPFVISLIVIALISGASVAFADDGCPNSSSEISTDRPDVTNSSRVVPYGSLQVENGVDWTVRQGSNVVSGSETRLRTRCRAMHRGAGGRADVLLLAQWRPSSGFSDLVVSIKRELPVPFG